MMSACRLKHVEVEKWIHWKKWKKCVKLVVNPELPQDARSTKYLKKLINRYISIHILIAIRFFFVVLRKDNLLLWIHATKKPFFPPVALQPKIGPRPPHCPGFRSHTRTHTVALLWPSDQPVAKAAAYTTHTTFEHPCPQRDSKSRIPAIKRLQTYALDVTVTIIGHTGFGNFVCPHVMVQGIYICD
jgi:hypothetical protein